MYNLYMKTINNLVPYITILNNTIYINHIMYYALGDNAWIFKFNCLIKSYMIDSI